MTYAPEALLDLRAYMKEVTGLSDNELGIVGDLAHDGGYHHGWDQRHVENGQTRDYSWLESPRDALHKSNAARAFDLGEFAQLREFSIWAVGECEKGAPDTLDLREIIYSPDGVVVKRWDRLAKRTSGDSSHRVHTHFSWFADAESRDKTGLFRRFFGGEEMPGIPFTQDYANQIWASTNRDDALLSGAPFAEFQIVGEPAPRREPNKMKEQLDRIEAGTGKLSQEDKAEIVAAIRDGLPTAGQIAAELIAQLAPKSLS